MRQGALARRILSPVPTLADYPDIVAQLDQKNGPIAPETIAFGSKRRLWWRCPEGPDHVWAVAVAARTAAGSGCPFCAGRAVSVTNALSKVAPAVARQWHPTKNGALRPRDVAAGTHRKVWWKCPEGPDHEGPASVEERVARRHGCPFCCGHRASAARNLAVVFPGIAEAWHPTKNGALRPEDVAPGASRKLWWKCEHGHEWSASPCQRLKGGCPYCSGHRVSPERSLAALAPDVARQWDRTKNGDLTPGDVTLAANRRVWWKCPEGPDHEWQARVATRTHGGCGCPFCAGVRVSVTNALAARFPDLAREWHPTKNGKLGPADVVAGTNRPAWWRCASGHEWRAVVCSRSRLGAGCPYCANLRVSATNSLAARFPALAREWHPTKNGKLGPGDVLGGTPRQVWWRCAFGHDYQAPVGARSGPRTQGCPECWRLRPRSKVVTTGKRGRQVRFAEYEGARAGPVRRVR